MCLRRLLLLLVDVVDAVMVLAVVLVLAVTSLILDAEDVDVNAWLLVKYCDG